MKKLLLVLISIILTLSVVSCGNQGAAQNASPKESSIFRLSDVRDCRVTGDQVDVKAGAGERFRTLTTVNKGEILPVLGEIGDWYVVRLDTNQIGCIDTRYATPVVKDNKPTTPPEQELPQEDNQQPTPGPTPSPTPEPTPPPPQRSPGPVEEEQQMVNLVNKERAKNNLNTLAVDPELTRMARVKAQDIVDNNYFSHYSPTYGSPFEMMDRYGIEYLHAGENLAANSSVERAHTSLMGSSGHRQNILSPDFTHIGVGVKPDKTYGYIFVQEFISKPQ